MMDDVLGKLVADKYRVESLICEGKSGDLYMGRHEVLGRPVLVKVLARALAVDARWVRRFIDESRTASAVTHPNILNITDFGTDARGISYAVFEPADGPTLRDVETGGSPLDEKRALEFARQIAMAVAAAHEKKVLHGGLDPQNIFINKTGDTEIVKVYGFGRDSMVVAWGSDPRYLSPEQCTVFPAADERSDIYSIGVMLYEMLSGVVPYDGATAAAVQAKQNAEPPPPLSAFRRDLHADVEPIVLSAMAADPDRRYQNIQAFAEDLALLSGGIGSPEKAAVAVADAPKRKIWQTAIMVVAGIALLGVSLIYLTSARKTDPTTNLQAEAGYLPVQPIGPATGAQEESLARLPVMTDADIMATSANTAQQPGQLPGGDGYNPWANGGAPPPGAPLNSQPGPPIGYVPPGGPTLSGDPNTSSPFMPTLDLVCKDVSTGKEIPCPTFRPAIKPTPTPKSNAANANTSSPMTAPTPKPLATPPLRDKPATGQPNKDKPAAPTAKPAKTPAKPADSR